MFQLITISAGGVVSKPQKMNDLHHIINLVEKQYGPSVFTNRYIADKLKEFMTDDSRTSIDFYPAGVLSFPDLIVISYSPTEDYYEQRK